MLRMETFGKYMKGNSDLTSETTLKGVILKHNYGYLLIDDKKGEAFIKESGGKLLQYDTQDMYSCEDESSR